MTTSSTPDPSRLARWILLPIQSVQYILPAATSKVMPRSPSMPEVIRSSTPDPSRLARWILSALSSVQ